MAQRVSVVYVDDIDGSDATESVNFGLDGVAYEIDLSDVHAKELRDAMDPFLSAARRVGGRKVSRKSGTSAASSNGDPTPAEIRAWGLSEGYDLPARGRIPEDVREAYLAAH